MLIVVEKKDKRDEYLIKILQKDGYNVMLFGAPCEKSTQKVYVMSITSLISEDTAEALDNNSVIFARDASDGVKAIFDKKI